MTSHINNKDIKNAYEKYYHQKELAKALEKTNTNKIIAFPSVETKGEKDEWLKISGNSALFYKYLVAPRLGKNPKINPDTDRRFRFENGVIMLHWKHLFLENLKKLNYTPREENGLLVFNLNHTFTDEEIKSLKTREKDVRIKTNRLLIPEIIEPKLYIKLIALTKTIPFKSVKLPDLFKESYGKGLNRIVTEMLTIYNLMVDGLLTKEAAVLKLRQSLAKMSALLIILNELKLFDIETENNLGHLLADIKAELREPEYV